MEVKNNPGSNCDCEGDYCQPKKKPGITKYLSILVLLIALSIIVIKVMSKGCETNCTQEALRVKSGVGCAAGIINGFLRGTEPNCDCGEGADCC